MTRLIVFASFLHLLINVNCEVYQDRPKIKTSDGDLILEPAYGKSIYLRPNGPKSSVFVGDLNMLKSVTNDQDIANVPSNNLKNEELLNSASSIQQRLNFIERNTASIRDELYANVSLLWRKVNSLTRQVRILSRANHRITDDCLSIPCKNGGTCLNIANGYICLCPSNWNGQDCDIDVNECLQFAGTELGCQNRAACINTPGSYECRCKPGWYGLHCTIKSRDCSQGDFEMCGHGTCLSDSTRPGITCICKQGWTKNGSSDECLTDINECDSYQGARCSVNPKVECINLPGSFRCGQCPPGYQGDGYTCSDINECATIPNGGCSPLVTCHNIIGSVMCGSCPSGYQGDGKTCTWRGTCAIDHGGCHPAAQCLENVSLGRAQCFCPLGMDGDGIGIQGCYVSSNNRQSCANNPCGTHGQCHQLRTGYTCICQQGYGGLNCSSISNACSSNPCQHGGICRSDDRSTDGFRCECMAQYFGKLCELLSKRCGSVLDAEEGSIVYPITNTTYNHNSRCAWVIHTAPNKVINVTFSKFSVEETASCIYDFLQIHDGRSSASQLIGRFCGYSFPNGGNIISTHNQLYFWFRSDNTVAKDGFTLHWTSIDPVCGGEINANTHGHISSPGSPGPYPNNRDCYWHLTTDYTKRLQIYFFVLDIENQANCSSDYLAIYDGMRSTDPLLNKYCNSSQPAPLQSAGSELLIHFHSGAHGFGKGFQLAYASIPGVPGCGGYFTTDVGEISSPAYNGTYLHGMLCEYKIKTGPDTKIKIHFKQFRLEKSSRCRYDYLKIYDGPTSESPVVGKFCGTTHPISYVSSSNVLFIKFKSDVSISDGGFTIHYEAICEYKLYGDSGVIKSPGYPFSYPHNIVCEYKINNKPGTAIQLSFQDFDIEDNNYFNCNFDNVEIRDGGDSNSTLLGKYCGGSDRIPPTLLSTYNNMYIRFRSDQSIAGTGFYANYTTVDTECGGIYRETTGLISYPSDGSATYKNEQLCRWILVAPLGMHIQLTWNRFDLEKTHSCFGDYLKLVEIDNNNGNNVIGPFCGSKSPPTLTTSTNSLMVLFSSDESVRSSGFSVSYAFLDDNTHCNRVYFKSHGFINSPGWPRHYEPNWDCTWVITVPVGQQIKLNISQFDLERPILQTCMHGDYLEIRNGASQNSPLIGQYCGHFNTKIIKSLSNTLYLHFHSDFYLTAKGFQLEWDGSIIGCGGTLTSSSGSISSPNYPENYNENSVCFYRIVTSLGSRILLTFTDLELERTPNCNDDYVKIFDGKDSSSRSLGAYCSMSSEMTTHIETTTNYAFIKFRSDFFFTGKGFLLNYRTICTNNITGRQGSIESPDYPNLYPKESNCVWNITVPKGNKINVTFISFDIFKDSFYLSWRIPQRHSQAPCSQDYVQWKEFSDTNYSNKFCGNSPPPMITTRGNSLEIKFSSGMRPRSGFRLEWVSFGCGGYIQKPSGSISIERNSVLSEELECEWLIEAPSGKSIHLVISELFVTQTENCTIDALEIYNGQNINAPVLTRLCHRQRSQIRTTSNYAYIRFVKRSPLKGAYFTSIFMSPKGVCGGNIESTAGYIYSQNYPNNYDNNMDCVWFVSVPVNHRIEFNFLDMDLYSNDMNERSPNCGDYINIYDASKYYNRLSNYTLKICPGSNLKRYITKSNKIALQFISDNYGTAKGFKANFSMTCGAAIIATNDGIISNKDYIGKSCMWTISAPKLDQKISLTITYILFPNTVYSRNGTNCWPSFVRLYDGDDANAPLIDEYCGKKAPPMIVTRGNTITISVGSYENNNIAGKFSAHYSSLNEACGGTLNSEEGSIASPNYPRPYPGGSNCEWILSTSPGNKVYVTFETFDLEYSERCNEDYLEIRQDNAMGNLLGVFCGTDVPLNTTVSSKLYVKFHSSDQNNGNGFLIHYGFLHGNELIDMDFGEIASPLYPQLYQGSATYSWRIQSSGIDPIIITIDNLEIASLSNVCENSLYIYDGFDDTAPLLSQLCGVISKPVKVFETSSNVAFIIFTLDFSNTGALFHLTWNKKQLNNIEVDSDKEIINCGTNVTTIVSYGNKSIFHSPGYPNDYENNLNCEWTFQALKGRHLKLQFKEFKLEEHNHCFSDYINIYSSDIPGQWNQLKDHLCLSQMAMQEINATTYLKVKFVTDSSVTRKGFKGVVSSVCGGSLTELSGEVMPYYQDFGAGFLLNPANCQWSIKVRPGRLIQLKFTHFNISNIKDSCLTSVVLRNGETSEAPLLGSGKYCGFEHENRENLTTSSNALHITYTRNILPYRIKTFQNFEIHYEEKGIECGGTSSLDLDHPWEIISSPNYPNIPDAFSECIWIFTAAPGENLRIDFIGRFDIDNVDDCVTESVEIRDGSSSLAPLIKRLCSVPETVKSSNNVIYVKYVTELSSPRNGFQANVSIGYCGGTIVAGSGVINSPGYPNDIIGISPNSVCEWRVKGPASHVFNIKAQDIDLPESENSCGTKVTIEEKMENSTIAILKDFCNDESDRNNLETAIETLSNEFVVKFSVGSQSEWSQSSAHKGFRISFSSSKPRCGGEVSTPEGYLTTPGYPLRTTLRYCQWRINVPDKSRRIKLELIDADTTRHIIGIYNDNSFQSLIQNIPSNDYIPSEHVFESTGNTLTLFLWLNPLMVSHRFKAKFNSDELALCGGDLVGVNGEISSPTIQRSYSCKWHYNSNDAAYKSILITIRANSSIAHSNRCRYTDPKLNIRSASKQTLSFLRDICGTTQSTFTIPSAAIDIKATKNSNISFNFHLTWKSQRCGGIINMDQNPVNILEMLNTTSDPIDCAWLLTMPYNNRLELKMEGSFKYNCDDEMLKIGQGIFQNAPAIGEYCKSNTLNDPLLISFTHVHIVYHSVNASSSNLKLMAKTVRGQCGGELSKYQNVFSSPNYPNNYEPNEECSWTITADVGNRISLKFIERFVLEDYPNCTKDAVIVYDWKNGVYEEIARLCGRPSQLSYSSTFNKMKVILRTDATTNLDGFKAKWTAICGGNYLASENEQILYSQGFPFGYYPMSNCTYVITAPQNKKLLIEFKEFLLEGTYPDCTYDNVTISGELENYIFEYEVYCGSKIPSLITKFDKVSIIFKSDRYLEMKGFKFTYQIDQCGGKINETALITSHHGDDYDADVNCTWFIQAPENKLVVLKFLYIDLESDYDCNNDYVAVYDEFQINDNKRLALMCGHINSSTVLRSNGNKVLLQFVSDQSYNFKGFKAQVLFTYNEKVGCGGRIDLTSSITLLKSFRLDGATVYENDIDCLWKITSPMGTLIKIEFLSFHISSCSNVVNQTAIGYSKCECDFVEIKDGINPESFVMGTYCGHTLPPQIVSSGNLMSVRLFTDSELVSSGFEAHLSAIQSECGPSYFTTGTKNNRVKSPGFDKGSVSRGLHCVYHFEAENSFSNVRLSINYIDLRSPVDVGNSKECSYDKLLIKSKQRNLNYTLGRDYIMNHESDSFIIDNYYFVDDVLPRTLQFCGSASPSDIYLSGSVTVTLITSGESDFRTHKGVEFEVNMYDGCGKNYTGTQGKIQTTYSARHDVVQDCYTLITAPENHTISAYFITVMPDYWNEQIYIDIYDGNNTSSKKLVTIKKDFETSIPFFSSGRYMLLHNHADGADSINFDMNFVTTDKGPGCGGKLMNQFGRVTSPKYPESYRMKASCEWELQTPVGTRLKIHFEVFDLGIICDQNYLELIDSKGIMQSTYCTEKPADYVSQDNFVKIVFHTTVNNGGTGWVVDFAGIV